MKSIIDQHPKFKSLFPQNLSYIKTFFVLLIIFILGGLSGYFVGIKQISLQAINQPDQATCTMDVMICPDGTSVGRMPPTCEFASCSGPNTPETSDQVVCTMEAMVCPDGTSVGRTGPNCEFTSCPTPTTTVDPTANWKTYRNEKYRYEFKYPSDLALFENNDITTVHSKIYQCETANTPPYLENITINASEIKIELKGLSGVSYEEIWKKEFGFDLTENINGKIQNNYDGFENYGGKRAYYFYEGAEMTFGRKAILIEKTPSIAILINSWTPILVYKCEKELNNYMGISNQILSTFRFIDEEAVEGKFCGGIAGFVCPEGYNCILDGDYPDAGGKCTKK